MTHFVRGEVVMCTEPLPLLIINNLNSRRNRFLLEQTVNDNELVVEREMFSLQGLYG